MEVPKLAVSEAERLLARGVKVTLGDKSYPLIFDFEALALLEEEMGGLDVFAQRLIDRKYRIRVVRAGMAAALAHTGLKRAEIVKLLEYRQTNAYLSAMSEAFMQALPEKEPGEVPKAEGSPNDSPGDVTTNSPPSLSGALTESSGG